MSEILKKKNVIGVAEGEKWVNGKTTGQPAMLVFVEKKVDIKDLAPEDIIEKEIDGMQTDVVGKSGFLKALAHQLISLRSRRSVRRSPRRKINRRRKVTKRKPIRRRRPVGRKGRTTRRTPRRPVRRAPRRREVVYNLNPRRRIRPIIGGTSVGHLGVTAGTIGGIFKDRNNQVVILSNNHVLANTNNAKIGDTIIQPGRADRGKTSDKVAVLKKFVTLKNGVNQDSAIAKVTTKYAATINKIGKVKGFASAKMNQKVRKSGRTTSHTSGKVIGLNGTFNVDYGGVSYSIRNCIVTTFMSKGGDSGSLLMDYSQKAVGLLFAGSNTITIHSPIQNAVKTYGLKIL
jgi:hypothetical protein